MDNTLISKKIEKLDIQRCSENRYVQTLARRRENLRKTTDRGSLLDIFAGGKTIMPRSKAIEKVRQLRLASDT